MNVQIFPTREFATFPDALQAVAQQEIFQANTPSAAAFACAGPITGNRCDMTNLDWTIDGDYLSVTHGIRYQHLLAVSHRHMTVQHADEPAATGVVYEDLPGCPFCLVVTSKQQVSHWSSQARPA